MLKTNRILEHDNQTTFNFPLIIFIQILDNNITLALQTSKNESETIKSPSRYKGYDSTNLLLKYFNRKARNGKFGANKLIISQSF